jgi:hypothetical protein
MLIICYEYFSWMLAKIPHSIGVKAHNYDWNVLTEPAKEFQNPSAIPISVLHQQGHNLADILVLQPL